MFYYLKHAVIFGLVLVLVSCSNNSVKSVNNTLPKENETVRNETVRNEPVHKENFEEKLDQFMSKMNYSGSVLLVKDNHVVIAKGYNMGDYGKKLPNGPDTVHQIGSLTKAFTAAAILQLQEADKLSVDDPVSTYIKDYPNDKVTLYHLLTHTSGIPNYTSFPDFFSTSNVRVSVDGLIAKFKDKPLEFEPGSQFAYSNSGYILLGAVIEQVSGQSYSDYLNEHIFTPLGMQRSGYLTKDNIHADVAVGYSFITTDSSVTAEPIDMTVPYSAGGIYSTVQDLHKWLLGLENGTILSEQSWERMRKPNLAGYALGWGIPDPKGMVYAHNGAINGFSSEIWRDMSQGTVVILLSNAEGIDLGNIGKVLIDMLDSDE
ncbi:serine hydrolase domain-containing protein [Paenibacillus sp. sgz500958]|uniref:serine hydrolase domain-containing protein n=1 Tax=Paenibacillus sp. sgz500958 TaxID=3242475 RepID=UPI0036D22706